ncbi:MAG TPA: hypothetical protein VFZ73_04275 [Gemmatimonadaceae bacterium]
MRRALLLILPAILPVSVTAQQPVAIPVGSPLVRPARIARGIERYEMVMVRDGQERAMGTYVVKVEEVNGVLLVTQETTMPQGSIIDSAWVDPVTFVPTRQVSYGFAGSSELRFDGTKVTGSRTPPGGVASAVEAVLNAAPFSGSLAPMMIRALPLDANFQATFPVYRDPGGMADATIRVLGREQVPGPGTTAWKVAISIGPQSATLWIDDAAGRELRTEAQMPGGVMMIMRPAAAEKKP